MNIVFATPGFSFDSKTNVGRHALDLVKKCGRIVGKVRLDRGAVVFTCNRAFKSRGSSDVVNAIALEALLDCLTNLNTLFLRAYPFTVPLYHSGVRYERTLVWDTIPALYNRQFGDCKSLTACRVAERRAAGDICRPVFRFDPQRYGTMFHILVMNPDGSFEDPSKVLGMKAPQELASTQLRPARVW